MPPCLLSPPIRTLSLPPWSPLRAYVPSCLRAFVFNPPLCQISKRTHQLCQLRPNSHAARTKAHCHRAPLAEQTHRAWRPWRHGGPLPASPRKICKTKPTPPATTRPNLPPRAPVAKQTHSHLHVSCLHVSPSIRPTPPTCSKPFQTIPTRPIHSIRQNEATCHFGSRNPLPFASSQFPVYKTKPPTPIPESAVHDFAPRRAKTNPPHPLPSSIFHLPSSPLASSPFHPPCLPIPPQLR
jgi:hypothetical protein